MDPAAKIMQRVSMVGSSVVCGTDNDGDRRTILNKNQGRPPHPYPSPQGGGV